VELKHFSERRNSFRVLVGKPEGTRPFGRCKGRWEDDIVVCRLLLGDTPETNNGTKSVTREQPREKQIYQSCYWVTPLQTNMCPQKRSEYNGERCFYAVHGEML
jgi:hypothetical protein